MPDFVKEAAAQEAESRKLTGWAFTLHAPSYIPFLKYSDRRDLWENIIIAIRARGNEGNEHDNKSLIQEIVNLRTEQALMMEEPDYASCCLKESMADSPAKVMAFLRDIHRYSKPAAQNELAEVAGFALFAEKGIFNREVASLFRKNILEKGGSEHPMELYKRFRGQEPNPEALLDRSGL